MPSKIYNVASNHNLPINVDSKRTTEPEKQGITKDGREVTVTDPSKQKLSKSTLGPTENKNRRVDISQEETSKLTIAETPKQSDDINSLLDQFKKNITRQMEIDQTKKTIDFFDDVLGKLNWGSDTVFEAYNNLAELQAFKTPELSIKMTIQPYGEINLLPPSNQLMDGQIDLKQVLEISRTLASGLMKKMGGENFLQITGDNVNLIAGKIDAYLTTLPKEEKDAATKTFEEIKGQGITLNSHWKDLPKEFKNKYYNENTSIEIVSSALPNVKAGKKTMPISAREKITSGQITTMISELEKEGNKLIEKNKNTPIEVFVTDDDVTFYRILISMMLKEKQWLKEKNSQEVRGYITTENLDAKVRKEIESSINTIKNDQTFESEEISNALRNNSINVVDGILKIISEGKSDVTKASNLKENIGLKFNSNNNAVDNDLKKLGQLVREHLINNINKSEGQSVNEGMFIDKESGRYGVKVNPSFEWKE